MRTIIAGSRNIVDYNGVKDIIDKCPWDITTVISGTANGVDLLGEQWANENNIQIEQYPAEWERYGMSAGYKRNELMVSKGDALLAIWDGASPGTKHTIDVAKKQNLMIKLIIL